MHLARTSLPAIPTTLPLSLEWEHMWRKGTWGGVEMGERRGCLIYWFHSCRRSSLLPSVRKGKWSMQAGKKKTLQITFSLNFLNSALTYLSRASSLSLPASVLPFPQCLSFTHKATCVLCLLQLCKQERPLGLALIGEHLRAPLTCICLFRMPRTTSNLYLLH